MKRIVNIMLALALILSLTVTAFANEQTLKLHTATAKKGETVYITVELTETVVGNSMGVTYTYNEKHLKPIPTSCSWARTGLMQDFDRKGGVGVWAADQSQDLKGGVCVLAFQVLTLAKFTDTQVTATVIVKNDSQEAGEFTATGKVILDCKHTYGDWQDGGLLGHYRTCSLCGGKQTQNHQWDNGTVANDPENPGSKNKVYTCTVCSSTKTETDDSQQLLPTLPEQTNPTVEPEQTGPVTQWDPDKQTTTPGLNQPTQPDQNDLPMQYPTETDEHSHDHEDKDGDDTIPQDVLEEILQEYEDEHAGHDHTGTETSNRPATAIAVIVAVVVLVGGMVLFVKKKR